MTASITKPILEALVTHYELVALVRKHYDLTADPKDVVRKGHVAEKLAAILDIANSPEFRSRVARAVRDGGWSRAKLSAGFRYYCRIREKATL